MKYKCLSNAAVAIPEYFFADLNQDALVDIESSITFRGEGDMFDHKILMDEIRMAIHGHEHERDQTDGIIAEILHRGLHLPRRDASFSSLWHYCSIYEYLDYIKWRWHDGTGINRERILGAWRRNGLGRLWWWAEITYDSQHNDPYHYTKRCARSQEYMLHAVDDFVGGDKGIVFALCDQLFPDDESMPDRNLVRTAFAKLNAVLDTIASDSLSDNDKKLLASDVIRDAGEQLVSK